MTEMQKTEIEIMKLNEKLTALRKDSPPVKVKNYTFSDLNGEVSLLDLFGDKDKLFMIHNMGQGCRYCTLWADGFNGLVQHLESEFALALASKDSPDIQQKISNSRGWRLKMVSHGGGDYIREQTVGEGESNMPGMVAYERKGSEIFRKNGTVFGPNDVFCPQWPILSLAGVSVDEWTPQFNYWQRPQKMDDGGQNLK